MNPILKSYFPIADIIAGTFGRTCEVVVHDLTTPESSVVYVVNGEVTGRQLGQSFDHLIKQVLLNKAFKADRAINYSFNAPNGNMIKSSSALIRDTQGEVIGALCINCDITAYHKIKNQLEEWFGMQTEQVLEPADEPEQDVLTVIDTLIAKIIGTTDVKNLTRKKSVELIEFMEQKGVFLVKGAIDKVADLMGVSKVTIYSYLDEVKGKR